MVYNVFIPVHIKCFCVSDLYSFFIRRISALRKGGGGGGGGRPVAQSVERTTAGEEDLSSTPAVAPSSLLVGSVSV